MNYQFSIDEIINTLVEIDKNFGSRDNINIEVSLDIYRLLIGRMGSVILISGINGHAIYEDDLDMDEDVYVIGQENREITLQDITQTFEKMKKQTFEEGRSYFYEGIDENWQDGVYTILWGS